MITLSSENDFGQPLYNGLEFKFKQELMNQSEEDHIALKRLSQPLLLAKCRKINLLN